MSQQQQQQQHTQEPVAEVYATSYRANDGDEHTRIEIRRLQNVKVGTLLYAFQPDAAALIAELEAECEFQRNAHNRAQSEMLEQGTELSARIAELEKQRDTLLAALEELNSVSARGFLYDDPARVKARAAIASVKEKA